MYSEGHSQKNKTLPPGTLGVKQRIPTVNERLQYLILITLILQ